MALNVQTRLNSPGQPHLGPPSMPSAEGPRGLNCSSALSLSQCSHSIACAWPRTPPSWIQTWGLVSWTALTTSPHGSVW